MISQYKKGVLFDSAGKTTEPVAESFDLPLARFVHKYKKSSLFLSRSGPTADFLNSHSRLYFTQQDLIRLRRGEKINRVMNGIDSLSLRYCPSDYHRYSRQYSWKLPDFYGEIKERYSSLKNYIKDLLDGYTRGVSPVRMWNLSVVGSIIFGMILMTMIYRYLGQGAAAHTKNITPGPAQVLGASDQKNAQEEALAEQIMVANIQKEEDLMGDTFEEKMAKMVKGYPIENMVPYIAQKDKIVAAFMISIARQESSWGTRVPLYKGKDCYNYWGYTGPNRIGTDGLTCFSSPKDAVDTVAKRLNQLVYQENMNTPGKMVSPWKCGYDCSWDTKTGVETWINSVSTYFKQF